MLEKPTQTLWLLAGCLATMTASCGTTLLLFGNDQARALGGFAVGLSVTLIALAAAIQLTPRLTPGWLTALFLAAVAVFAVEGALADTRFTGDSVGTALRGLAIQTAVVGAAGAVVLYAVSRRAARRRIH